ncbi:hypothetical protein WJX82_011427 [Trebouxia sp. C0006]
MPLLGSTIHDQEPHPHEPHAQQEDNYISDEQLEEEDPHGWINDFSAKEAPAGHISGLHDHEGIDKGFETQKSLNILPHTTHPPEASSLLEQRFSDPSELENPVIEGASRAYFSPSSSEALDAVNDEFEGPTYPSSVCVVAHVAATAESSVHGGPASALADARTSAQDLPAASCAVVDTDRSSEDGEVTSKLREADSFAAQGEEEMSIREEVCAQAATLKHVEPEPTEPQFPHACAQSETAVKQVESVSSTSKQQGLTMAQRASVLTLDRQSLRSALDPGQYHELFQADDLLLAMLAVSESSLRILDADNATQKGECEYLLSAQALDPRCTAIISIVPECRGQDGSKNRRRTLSESTAHFPTHNQQGKMINQGPGGDLSFLPATHPLICKQSCKYTLLSHDGEWSSKREFASHKLYSVTHSMVPASVVTINDIEPKDTTGILFTTTQPHGFKSRRTFGQLYASGEQTASVPAAFLQTAFKIAAVPSPLQFTIQSPIKGLQKEEQMTNLTTQLVTHLQAGSLHLTFGESFVVNTSKFILHTMETTDPLPSASQAPVSPPNIPQMALQHMMTQLGETNPGLPIKVGKLLQQLGHQATWNAFLEAQTTSVLARDGTARSRGGAFLALLKNQKQAAKLRQIEEQAVHRTNSALHGYQQQLVDCVSKGQNHIIVAPTGSGKTRVAVEVAGLLFLRKPSARILFLTPTVALAEQQTGVFRAAKCIPDGVACFSSENPISGRQWPSAIKANHVLVMTVQALLNMLEDGNATLQAFDLMVFDECHHTQNNHPFNKVALKYRQLTHQQQSCLQVLGLTATPAVDSSLTQTYALQDRLQKNMCASYLIISADHAEVKQVVGETREITRLVATRYEDVTFARDLGTVLLDHLTQMTELDFITLMDADALAEITSSLRFGRWSARLKHWLTTQAATVPQTSTHFRAHLALLQDCNIVLSLLKDTGFEMALQYLANKWQPSAFTPSLDEQQTASAERTPI